eukprot:m.127329 g.127329  ORF g.127329 m.127329 type:complete len:136 (-) comp15799_c0_seq12:319-726(-)
MLTIGCPPLVPGPFQFGVEVGVADGAIVVLVLLVWVVVAIDFVVHSHHLASKGGKTMLTGVLAAGGTSVLMKVELLSSGIAVLAQSTAEYGLRFVQSVDTRKVPIRIKVLLITALFGERFVAKAAIVGAAVTIAC